uniref:Thyroglobulin type-1 domain-containing protein n=1 Tax=Labrus bergylta TaxID=56723 RepID=A0A3Q3ETM2_9LABR
LLTSCVIVLLFTCFHSRLQEGSRRRTQRTRTPCEIHRDSVPGPRGPRPHVGQYIPACDEDGRYEAMQCHGSSGHCWCVDRNGQEIPGSRSGTGSRPMCE